MNLNVILREKGNAVFTTSPDNTLAEVVASLVEHNCGSLVVCDEGQVVGIITERDILRATAKDGGDALTQNGDLDFRRSGVFRGAAMFSNEFRFFLFRQHFSISFKSLYILTQGIGNDNLEGARGEGAITCRGLFCEAEAAWRSGISSRPGPS